MTELPNPADRIRAVRQAMAEQTAKLPTHSPSGNHDGGIRRHYRDAAAVDLTDIDTGSRSYGGDRADQPHEQVRTGQADPDDTPSPSSSPRAAKRTAGSPKPDPSQGGSGGHTGDSPELAAKQGRWRDVISMNHEQWPPPAA